MKMKAVSAILQRQRGSKSNGGPEEPQWRPRGASMETQRSLRGAPEEAQRGPNGVPEGPQWRPRGALMKPQRTRGPNRAAEEAQRSLNETPEETQRGLHDASVEVSRWRCGGGKMAVRWR